MGNMKPERKSSSVMQRDMHWLCVCFFFLQGSPGFGIPGQPGLKGDPGDRVSGATHGVWKGGANRHTGRFRGNISVAAAGVFAPDCGRQC